jgi:Periplasmic copper-binding protein (NosD)
MGVRISGSASKYNYVFNDLIGTNFNGDAAVPNGRYGVAIENGASSNIIGRFLTNYPTIISGNGASGVIVRGAGTGENLIVASLIGTNAAGSAALPNAESGVEVTQGASGTLIGTIRQQTDTRNIISGNTGNGVRVAGAATLTTIRDNDIGLDPSHTQPVGNGGNGVLITGSSGNSLSGDWIWFNGRAGVKVDGSTGPANGNEIIGSRLDQSGGLGIQLVGGANDGQAAPTIVSVTTDAQTHVKATLTGPPSTQYLVQMFTSPSCDPSGRGEGAQLLQSAAIQTNASGNASFTIQRGPPPIPSGLAITLTATRQDTSVPDTSEFSNCATAP